MNCWELKDCIFNKMEPQESKCPVYKQQCGCWEFDWVSFYNQMPECKEKEEWKKIMLTNCPECVVYKHKKENLEAILDSLGKNN